MHSWNVWLNYVPKSLLSFLTIIWVGFYVLKIFASSFCYHMAPYFRASWHLQKIFPFNADIHKLEWIYSFNSSTEMYFPGDILILINTSMRISTLKQQLLNSYTTKNIWSTCFPLWKVLINSVRAVILRTHIWTVELQHGLALQKLHPAKLRSKTGTLEQLVL